MDEHASAPDVDDDGAVAVRAQGVHAGTAERVQRAGGRVPVGVAASHFDDREPRAHALQQAREPVVVAAVVADLQDVDRTRVERRQDVGLGVGGQQQPDAAAAEAQYDRALVRVSARDGSPSRRGGESTSAVTAPILID